MIKLGINVDHVGTLRNSRGESHPDPYLAAKVATKYGANSITIHLREDRRHINDLDVRRICKNKKLTVNLEMAANFKMLKIALFNKPSYVCLVPERRKEITTEGGLNISKNKFKLKKIIQRLNKAKIRTSLFIDPTKSNIKLSKELHSNCVELHTGRLAGLVKKKKSYSNKNEQNSATIILTGIIYKFSILWIAPNGIKIVSSGFIVKYFLFKVILGLP